MLCYVTDLHVMKLVISAIGADDTITDTTPVNPSSSRRGVVKREIEIERR